MSPILSYSGTRPLKKKKGGGRVIRPLPDQVLYELNNIVNFDVDVPAKVRENVEADIKNLWKIRYTDYETHRPGAEKTKDEETGIDIYLGGTDPTEYEELPGARGVPFDLGAVKDKGLEAALMGTLNSFKDSVINLRDLLAQNELASLWDPLISPHVGEEGTGQAFMSLNAGAVALNLTNEKRLKNNEELLTVRPDIKDLIFHELAVWRDEDGKRLFLTKDQNDRFSYTPDGDKTSFIFQDESGLTRNFISELKVGADGKKKQSWYEVINGEKKGTKVDVTTIESVNRLGSGVRDFVVSGNNSFSRKVINFPKVQQNMVDILEVSLARFPREVENPSPALQASREVLLGRLDTVKKLQITRDKVGKKKEAQAGDKGKGGQGIWKFVPNPVLDEEVKKANDEYSSALNKLWYDLAKNKDDIANTAATYADPRFVAWVEILNFRNNVFEWNERLDNVAEGNIFKNIIWQRIKKTKLVYFTPEYWLKTSVDRLKKRYAEPLLKRSKFINDWIHVLTEKIVNSKAGRTALNILGGQPIKIMVTRIVTKAMLALGSTGVGTAPAILIAGLTYAIEKAGSVLTSFVRLDLDKALDQITTEMTNIAKAAGIAILIVALPSIAIYFYLAVVTIAPLAGTDAGEGGQGGVYGNMDGNPPPGPGPGDTQPPGGSGVACGNFGSGVDNQNLFNKTGYKESITIEGGGFHFIASCFAEDRGDYCHGGIDLNAGPESDDGKDIRSPFNGNATVAYSGFSTSGFGNLVILQVDDYFMYFAHMKEHPLVYTGQKVSKDELMGHVGSTGNSSGPHVHYEIRSGADSPTYAVNPCYVFQCPNSIGLTCNTEIYNGQL